MTTLRATLSPWHVVPAILVVVLTVAVVKSPTYALAALAALLVAALVVRHPAAVLMVALFATQEISPNEGQFGGLTSFGHQVYYLGQVPPIALLAVLAAAVAITRGGWPEVTAGGKAILATMALLAGSATVMGLYAGQSPLSALNQSARPFVLLICGLLVGAAIRTVPGEHHVTVRAAAWSLGLLAVAAVVAVAAGQSADPSVSPLFIYYDSATSAAAGAVLLAVLFAGRWPRGSVIVGVAALVIVVVGFRRNVWAAVVVALLVALLVSRSRLRAWAPLAFAAVPTVAAAAMFPTVTAAIGARAADAWYTVTGQADEASTRSHLNDIQIGWEYVQQHPWAGVGPNAPQLTGLVDETSKRVYVHNEWLLDWLRFGLTGIALVAVLTVILVVVAARVLRRRDPDVVDLSAAMFLLIAPVSMTTAPFLSTTSRWPLLVGVAVGALVARRFGPRTSQERQELP